MVRTRAVSVRGRKAQAAPQGTKLKNFRCPEPIDRYLREVSKEEERDQTDIIVGAIELDRDLAQDVVEPERPRLESFAASMEMTMEGDSSKVLAQLIRRGLDAIDAEQASKHLKKK